MHRENRDTDELVRCLKAGAESPSRDGNKWADLNARRHLLFRGSRNFPGEFQNGEIAVAVFFFFFLRRRCHGAPEERRIRRGDVRRETASHDVAVFIRRHVCFFLFSKLPFFSDTPAVTAFSSPSGAAVAAGAGAKWKMSLKPNGQTWHWKGNNYLCRGSYSGSVNGSADEGFFLHGRLCSDQHHGLPLNGTQPRVGVLIARRGIAKCFSASAHVLASALGPFTNSQSHARKVNAYVTFVQFFKLSNSKNRVSGFLWKKKKKIKFFQNNFFYYLYQIYAKYMPNTKHLIALNLVEWS